jgi:6-phosphogluconolactonase (cycloisomerase 2 family)
MQTPRRMCSIHQVVELVPSDRSARYTSLRWWRGLAMSLLLYLSATPVFADLSPGAVWVANKTVDSVSTYAIAADGTLSPVSEASAGTTPVALAVHPSGVFAYGLNNASLPIPDLSVYQIDPTNHALTELARVRACNNPNWLAVHPHGRTLYFTCNGFAQELPNVALNALAWVSIDPVTGGPTIDPVTGGPAVNTIYAGGTRPAEGAVHDSGRYLVLANYLSDLLAVFGLDPDTDAPTLLASVPIGDRPDAVDGPVSLAFDASGTRLFAALYDARQLWVGNFDATTGALTEAAKVSTQGFPTAVRGHPTNAAVVYVTMNSVQDAMTGEVGIYTLETGLLMWVNTVPTGGASTQAIALHRTGQFAYVANHYALDRHTSGNLAMYAVDAATGNLTPIGLGNIATSGFATTVITSNPVADQARQDLLARAATDARFGVPLFGSFAEDLTGEVLAMPGFEIRWLVFRVTGDRFGVIFHATSTSDLLQRWTLMFVDEQPTPEGWVPAF